MVSGERTELVSEAWCGFIRLALVKEYLAWMLVMNRGRKSSYCTRQRDFFF